MFNAMTNVITEAFLPPDAEAPLATAEICVTISMQ